ncbi:hypothetical protein LJR225_000610 [Phenylobacterium sp. LjRoot225]|uniref:hypothetical protein n=1 Tax=Phenylobacterium sp. LjRoot225 TaxID=3342285 RepID=UPI003ECD7298
MASRRTGTLKHLSDAVLTEALARAPSDHFIIWNGRPCPAQSGSIRSQALALVAEVWEPVPLRVLLTRAARLSGLSGLDPDTVRSAVRMHQSASQASYFLVRRTLSGDYLAVADVPCPSSGARRLSAGDRILGRAGERFDDTGAANEDQAAGTLRVG